MRFSASAAPASLLSVAPRASPRASATVRPSSAARRARRALTGASPRLAPPRAFLDRFRLPSPALPGKRSRLPTLTGADVVPGQGKGAPAWSEMHDALNALGVRGVDARDLPALVARPDVLLLDVRQTLEHEEWRLVDSASVPYAIPDPNVARRVVGYAVSIKGGLKVRNPAFVDETRAAVESAETETSIAIDRIVLIDTKGGDLDAEPVRAGSSGVYDPTDAACLRAAFELTQSGDFPAARVAYARGGLPAAIEDAGMAYESAKWGAFLSWLDRTGRGETRRLLMYSRLLPDPTNLPGVVGQGAVFLTVGLAYYDVGGVGTWAAAHVPAACALLPVCGGE